MCRWNGCKTLQHLRDLRWYTKYISNYEGSATKPCLRNKNPVGIATPSERTRNDSRYMNNIKDIFIKKSPTYIVISLIYLILLVILKWQIHLDWDTLWFVLGGILGIYFIDLAELVFAVKPSPFRSVVFLMGLVIVSVFIITSSVGQVARGLVLTISLTLLFSQINDWQKQHHLDNWYSLIAVPVARNVQLIVLLIYSGFFVLESLLFIR
jgi:hypothetical protein